MNFDRSLAAMAVIATVALVGLVSGDPGLLLGLAPAIMLLASLLIGLFPGERAIESAGRWLSELRAAGKGRPRHSPLPSRPSIGRAHLDRLAFRTRGPPVPRTI